MLLGCTADVEQQTASPSRLSQRADGRSADLLDVHQEHLLISVNHMSSLGRPCRLHSQQFYVVFVYDAEHR